MPEESRIDRLLRRAEESAEAGEYEKSAAILDVLRPAIYLRNREVKELNRLTARVEP